MGVHVSPYGGSGSWFSLGWNRVSSDGAVYLQHDMRVSQIMDAIFAGFLKSGTPFKEGCIKVIRDI